MTANTQDLKNTLEAQNFQDEQILNKENRKTLHKMMKYVRTFPLKSIEIEQIRRDLTGMAIEAQQRGTSLQAMLGEKPRIIGAMSIVCDLISIFALLIIAAGSLLNTGEPDLRIMDLLSVFWSLAIAIFHYTAGKRAYQYANDITKTKFALRWGIGVFVFDFIVNLSFFIETATTPSLPLSLILLSGMLSILFLIFPILYVVGAYRNRPHSGTP